MISTCTLNQSFDAIYIYIFFDRRRKKNWRVDEPWKKGEKRWRFVMQNHWIIFSTIQNCEVTELNLKKSFLKRLITTPYFSSSIDSCISSRLVAVNFYRIRSDHDSENVVHEVRRYTRRAEDIERDAPDSPFSAVPARGSLHRPGYPVEEDLFPEHN